MIRLVAMNQLDGLFYYSEDDQVYLLMRPFDVSSIRLVDTLDTFLRKSFDADLDYEDKNFETIEELINFAKTLPTTEIPFTSRGMLDAYDYFLEYAPLELVKEYILMVEELINTNDLKGVDVLIRQIAKSYVVVESDELSEKLNNLEKRFEKVRYPYIDDSLNVANIVNRIKANKNPLVTELAYAS